MSNIKGEWKGSLEWLMNEVFFGDRSNCWEWPFSSYNQKGYPTFINNSGQNYREDTVKAGNHARGETNGHAKLTEEDVLYIRSVGEMGRSRWPRRGEENSQADLAEQFDVTPGTINSIIARRVWKHI